MRYKAVVFDLDGVIFQQRNFWRRMHKAYGTWEEGEWLTELYLKEDFKKLVTEVVGKLWKGKGADKFHMVVRTSRYNKGVRETITKLREAGLEMAIISSAPDELALKVRLDMGIKYNYANKIEIKDGKFTGKFFAMQDFHGKDKTLFSFCKEIGVKVKDVAVVGDGENDISMFRIAGKAIGFNILEEEKKKIGRHCDVIVGGNDLREILPHVLEEEKQ